MAFDFLNLVEFNVDTVYAFNVEFPDDVMNHFYNLLTKKDCYVEYVVMYDKKNKANLEVASKDTGTEWEAYRDAESGKRVCVTAAFACGKQQFSAYFYKKKSKSARPAAPEVHKELTGAWDRLFDATARAAEAKVALTNLGLHGLKRPDEEQDFSCCQCGELWRGFGPPPSSSSSAPPVTCTSCLAKTAPGVRGTSSRGAKPARPLGATFPELQGENVQTFWDGDKVYCYEVTHLPFEAER